LKDIEATIGAGRAPALGPFGAAGDDIANESAKTIRK